MPKIQFLDPKEIRKPGEISFGKIPVNQYNKSIQDEKKNFSQLRLMQKRLNISQRLML